MLISIVLKILINLRFPFPFLQLLSLATVFFNFEPKMIRYSKSEEDEEDDDGRDCKDVQEISDSHLHQLLLP